MKYRKKPIVIEAIHWTGNREVVDEFMGVTKHPDDANHAYYRTNDEDKVIIKTLEGNLAADIGDYIIKGVKGEFYPCKPDIFDMTYERV